MLSSAQQPEIHALIEAKDFATLKSALSDMEIHDLAELLARLKDEDLAVAFRLLPQDRAGDILGDLEYEQQEELLTTLSSEKVAAILNEMPPDDRTELLEELPGELSQRLLADLRGEERQIARSLLAYPEDSVGRLMTPEYVAIRPEWTIRQVLDHIRTVGEETETLHVLYVVDERGMLLDALTLEQLVLADPARLVSDLMDELAPSLQASEDQESAVELLKKYDAIALPVVNRQGVLVGIVTHDDVLDVAEEEDTEDMQKMAGMAALEGSYFSTGYFQILAKRLPWLLLLLAAQTLTTTALTQYHALPLFAVLVIFMPLINSPAGNTGSQMAGLMIRSLAVAEMSPADWWKVLLRELARGLTLGVILAAAGFIAALLFARAIAAGPPPQQIALAVAMAMFVAVTLANIVGSMMPLIFKRIGLDPAVTSGPFIASVMDIAGIVIYFSIGTAMLSLLG